MTGNERGHDSDDRLVRPGVPPITDHAGRIAGRMDRSPLEAKPGGIDAGRSAPRLHDTIARSIGVRIAAEELLPGDLLSGEIEAAEQLDVSRTAYREAVRILAAKGMVESRTKTGTRVSPRERWHLLDPEVLGWFLETKPSETFVHDLFELRMMVEPHAAELAARHRRDVDLVAMEESLQTMARETLTTEEGRVADRTFHQTILAATGNELIVALASGVVAAIRWTTAFKSRTQRNPRDPINEHRDVLEAIRIQDAPGARAAMAELVQKALVDMRASLTPNTARRGRPPRGASTLAPLRPRHSP